VEHEVYDYNVNNWSHRNSNNTFKENFENHTRKKFNRYTKKTHILGTSHITRKVLQYEITMKFIPYRRNGANQVYQIEMTPVGESGDQDEG
jgi:hypothetical protein